MLTWGDPGSGSFGPTPWVGVQLIKVWLAHHGCPAGTALCEYTSTAVFPILYYRPQLGTRYPVRFLAITRQPLVVHTSSTTRLKRNFDTRVSVPLIRSRDLCRGRYFEEFVLQG